MQSKLLLLFIFSLVQCKAQQQASYESFQEALQTHQFTLMNFQTYWSQASQAFAPIFSEVTNELAALHPEVFVATGDASGEVRFGEKFHILSFPSVRLFVKGIEYPIQYNGPKEKEALLNWVLKRINTTLIEVTDPASIQTNTQKNEFTLLFLGSSDSDSFKEFEKIVRLFENMGALYSNSKEVKSYYDVRDQDEALVVIRDLGNDRRIYTKQLTFEGMRRFINGQRYNEVATFGPEVRHRIFEAGEDIVLLLKGDDEEGKTSEETFRKAAQDLKNDIGFAVATVGAGHDTEVKFYDLFKTNLLALTGLAQDELPAVIIIQHRDRSRKFILDGEISREELGNFVDGFIHGKVKPYIQSAPSPNQPYVDNVRILVGKTYSGVVYDRNKDVLVSLCSPGWHGCKDTDEALKVIARKLKDFDDVVIAKLDTYPNDIDIMEHIALPAIVLYPKGNKEQYVLFDRDMTRLGLLEFLSTYNSAINVSQWRNDPDLQEPQREVNIDL